MYFGSGDFNRNWIRIKACWRMSKFPKKPPALIELF
jgi:hypothetical protein